MTDRITDKHLDALCERLNKITGSPMTYMDGDRHILVGHFHIDSSYGGWNLARTMNTSGGITCPISAGHLPARELYERMYAYIRGIEFGCEFMAAREVTAMSPSELKAAIESRGAESHFFTRKTMQFFGDTMRNFGVRAATVRTAYNAAGDYVGPDGIEVPAWELYRKHAVKHGLRSSHYFARDDFRQLYPVKETDHA